MARTDSDSFTSLHIDAPVESVFALLADPWTYADWVVGSDRIRSADPNWPAVGSEFHHTVGVWPLKSHDRSFVEESDPPNHLQLRVKARPFVTARVQLDLRKDGSGTVVEMAEHAADPLSHVVLNRITQPLVHLRNQIALRRLRDMAEGTRRPPSKMEAQSN